VLPKDRTENLAVTVRSLYQSKIPNMIKQTYCADVNLVLPVFYYTKKTDNCNAARKLEFQQHISEVEAAKLEPINVNNTWKCFS
jgi:hypothetical protein